MQLLVQMVVIDKGGDLELDLALMNSSLFMQRKPVCLLSEILPTSVENAFELAHL